MFNIGDIVSIKNDPIVGKVVAIYNELPYPSQVAVLFANQINNNYRLHHWINFDSEIERRWVSQEYIEYTPNNILYGDIYGWYFESQISHIANDDGLNLHSYEEDHGGLSYL